jgi:hypothetical protein
MRLLDALQQYLIDQGLVRSPSTPGPLPPLWKQPRGGTPGPGQGQAPAASDTVAAVFATGGWPSEPLMGWVDARTVELRIRARSAAVAEDLAFAVRLALDDRDHFDLAGLVVEQCLLWRPWQVISSDDTGYEGLVAFRFLVRTSSYAVA